MGTPSGEATLILVFAANLIRGQLLKKRICSRRSKFFPFKVNPILGRLRPLGKQTGSHENYLPLKNIAEKVGGVPIHLKNLNFEIF